MNIAIVSDAPFGNVDAFNDFLGVHDIAHQTIARFLASAGRPLNSVPLADTPVDNPDWMLDHYQIHVSIGSAIRQSVPDLSSVDLTNEEQYRDWMLIHADLHEQINYALRITT